MTTKFVPAAHVFICDRCAREHIEYTSQDADGMVTSAADLPVEWISIAVTAAARSPVYSAQAQTIKVNHLCGMCAEAFRKIFGPFIRGAEIKNRSVGVIEK